MARPGTRTAGPETQGSMRRTLGKTTISSRPISLCRGVLRGGSSTYADAQPTVSSLLGFVSISTLHLSRWTSFHRLTASLAISVSSLFCVSRLGGINGSRVQRTLVTMAFTKVSDELASNLSRARQVKALHVLSAFSLISESWSDT